MKHQRALAVLIALFSGAALGCEGQVGSPPGTGTGPGPDGNTGVPGVPGVPGGPTDPNAPPGPSVDPADPNAAGAMPLRRLNRREYNNTIAELFGDDSRPADAFPIDRDDEFLFARAGLVSVLDADVLRTAAEGLAASANVQALLPCQPDASGEEACARQFVETFGSKAYRRPLLAEEVERLMALYQDARTAQMLDFQNSVRLLIEAVLQAPAFIYRWEVGPSAPTMEGPVVKLDPYSVASRLSYFLWRSMPDQALFDAAAQNLLGTEAEVQAQAERMLNDPRARETTAAFFSAWLGLDRIDDKAKDLATYPEYQADLKAAMAAETEAFASNVIFNGDGYLSTLLTSTSTQINEPLAELYGAAGVTGPGQQAVTLDPSQRAGLLTHAGFLAVTGSTDGSNPVKRGKAVLLRLMCGELPPPPPNVPPPKPASEGGTTRDRFAEHGAEACATCHTVMDPIGFAFENYDGIGRYRTLDNGLPVDASGSVPLDSENVTFQNALELSALLAQSPQVAHCFAKHWAEYAFDRPETALDAASIDGATQAFEASGRSVRALLVGLTSSRSFRYRIPAAGEAL